MYIYGIIIFASLCHQCSVKANAKFNEFVDGNSLLIL